MKRDHDAEWSAVDWRGSTTSRDRVTTVDGVHDRDRRSRKGCPTSTPSLKVIVGSRSGSASPATPSRARCSTASRASPLLRAAAGLATAETGVSITPYMMAAGRRDRSSPTGSHAVLSNPPRQDAARTAAAPAADLSGHWDVQIEYAASASTHTLHLRQTGSRHRRHASGRLRVARSHRHDRRRRTCSSAAATTKRTATPELPLHRHGRRRRDGRHARHGRVPERDVDGDAPRRRGEAEHDALRRATSSALVVLAWPGRAASGARLSQRRRSRSTTCCSGAATSSTRRNSISAVRDVAIADGKVAAVAAQIDPGRRAEDGGRRRAST